MYIDGHRFIYVHVLVNKKFYTGIRIWGCIPETQNLSSTVKPLVNVKPCSSLFIPHLVFVESISCFALFIDCTQHAVMREPAQHARLNARSHLLRLAHFSRKSIFGIFPKLPYRLKVITGLYSDFVWHRACFLRWAFWTRIDSSIALIVAVLVYWVYLSWSCDFIHHLRMKISLVKVLREEERKCCTIMASHTATRRFLKRVVSCTSFQQFYSHHIVVYRCWFYVR